MSPPPSTGGLAAVICCGISKSYGNREALSQVNLSIDRGVVHGLLGHNGAGKSTLLHVLAGLLRPSSGSAKVLGIDVLAKENLSAVVGLVPDAPNLYPYLTGRQHLNLVAKVRGSAVASTEIDQHLDRVGLLPAAGRKVREYSFGMRQRLSWALAIVHRPAVVLLDEPTNGLDPEGIRDLRSFVLDEVSQRSVTIVLSSHILDLVTETCDELTIIKEGSVRASGKRSDIVRPGEALETAYLRIIQAPTS